MFRKILFAAIVCFICLCVGLWGKKGNGVTVVQFASWGSDSEIKILKPILEDYERKNPNIKVDFLHIPQNYFQKIHLLFASNTAPDVVFLNNQYMPIYANAGMLEDLTNINFEFDKFYKKSLDSLTWNNRIYAVPRDVSNLVVFFNKDLFKKYGVSIPQSGWSLEDFLEISKKISHIPEVFGVSFEEYPLFYIPYMTTCGGWDADDTKDFFKMDVLNREKNKKGLNFYSDLRLKYHTAPLKEEIGSETTAQMFLQGKLGMQVSGRWLVPKYRQEAEFEWDIIEFPSCKKGESTTVSLDSSGWAISKSSKHKQEAIKLIKYLSSEKSITQFSKSGLIVPARIDVAESEYFLDGNKPQNAKIFLSVIETSVPTPVTVNYREILDSLQSKTEYMFNR